MIMVGGELTLDNTALSWSESGRFYEAPVQIKANGGTLVIDDFGQSAYPAQELLNRWILPLERRVDYLALRNGKKIELPFEQLVVFSTISTRTGWLMKPSCAVWVIAHALNRLQRPTTLKISTGGGKT